MKAPTMDEWAEKLGTKALNGFVYEGRTLREWIDLMASGYCVVLPDGATNGDVIKAMFPNLRFGIKYTYNVCIKLPYHSEHDTGLLFDKDWWNAPYKGGKE